METTASRASRESRALDSDQAASHPSVASYIRARAARVELSADDPVPLFLSDPLSEPDPREFAPRVLQARSTIVLRVLVAVLALSSITILGAVFQSDLRGLLAADAASSAGSMAPNQAMAPAAPQIPLKEPARATNTMLASADGQDLAAPSTPSREAIAAAYQSALLAQTPVQAPAPVAAQAAPPEPVRTLDADTLAGLMTRAKSLIGVGDIAAARLLLERAANAGDATAALLLARTYDPAVLGRSDARSIIADPAAARDWYQRAAALGSVEAQQRLAQLSN